MPGLPLPGRFGVEHHSGPEGVREVLIGEL
jgi:hypothetical protein